jgi:hypothetical protein
MKGEQLVYFTLLVNKLQKDVRDRERRLGLKILSY